MSPYYTPDTVSVAVAALLSCLILWMLIELCDLAFQFCNCCQRDRPHPPSHKPEYPPIFKSGQIYDAAYERESKPLGP